MEDKIYSNYALVTGASDGIGFALTEQLIKTHHVIAVSRTKGQLDKLTSNKLKHWSYDLANNDDRLELIDRANSSLPHLDLLVNNAAIQNEQPLGYGDWSISHQELELNLAAPIHLSTSLLCLLEQATHPRIINMGSILGFSHRKVSPIYSITKAGIHQFSRILNTDGGKVKVVEYIPPMIATNMTKERGHHGLMTTDELVKIITSGIDRSGIYFVGKARTAKWLHALSPALLSRLINGAGQ